MKELTWATSTEDVTERSFRNLPGLVQTVFQPTYFSAQQMQPTTYAYRSSKITIFKLPERLPG